LLEGRHYGQGIEAAGELDFLAQPGRGLCGIRQVGRRAEQAGEALDEIAGAPCASAVTIVVVAKRISSTTTTLPGMRTPSSPPFFVST